MGVRILSIIDDIADEAQEGEGEKGAVYIPTREESSNALVELLD
jgi:hypothetical protein